MLEGGFLTVAQPDGDHVPVAPIVGPGHHHDVAVANHGVDHRVALDLQSEQTVVAGEQPARDFDRLIGAEDRRVGSRKQYRLAGEDPADERDPDDVRQPLGRAPELVRQPQAARDVLVPAQEALFDQAVQVVVDDGGRGDIRGVPDLADRRRVAVVRRKPLDELEHPLLAIRELAFRHRASSSGLGPVHADILTEHPFYVKRAVGSRDPIAAFPGSALRLPEGTSVQAWPGRWPSGDGHTRLVSLRGALSRAKGDVAIAPWGDCHGPPPWGSVISTVDG